jgi:hypothetical protein
VIEEEDERQRRGIYLQRPSRHRHLLNPMSEELKAERIDMDEALVD